MEQSNLPQSAPEALPTSVLAIVSLISGLAGIFFFPVIGGIIAIVTGNMAYKETRSFPATRSGDGLATAGTVLGWISLMLWIIICCVLVSGAVLGSWFFATGG